jgi:DNA uptake protein ComE-like DNA-binding protein
MTLRIALLALSIALVACGGDAADDTATSNDTTSVVADSGNAAPSAAPATTTKLNLNTATEDQFRTIPGVGEKMAHEFEEYRPFKSIQQFRKEIGKYTDAGTIAEYEKYVFVPIDPNQSDAATLQQIPGVAPDEAEQLVGARPFGSTDTFFEMLAGFVSPDELAVARTYVTAQ